MTGSVQLGAGPHSVTVHYDGPDLVSPNERGPATLSGLGRSSSRRARPDHSVQYVQPQGARTLCSKRLDWIEAVAP